MNGELFARARAEIAPGAVHVPDWLPYDRQRELLESCRAWSRPPAGLRSVKVPGGGTMSARQVCLGHHWLPYRYTDTAVDGDGAPVKPFPGWLKELANDALREAFGPGTAPEPYDVALINFYAEGARMGMHRDAEEESAAPVVSLSLGDTCVFRFGNTDDRGQPYRDVDLRSGDLFVFGGPARLAYHGVPRVKAHSGPPGLGLTGRLNLTLRVSGLPPTGH
ncbi:alpha-ketoglutarate-dependent dioxygenase AlkB [Streptomyces sp. NA04227]|uniref:alpha-ketoglutarate-dependent dioxygenase AlkB family protein n=1 Tax=Streptomyces sp. NA04227 TaxID=2742136 RepID=UPI0015925F66|nr:alpha-ketoglutarate-dependent dioxygenase AlkB [Streptomyces sp. NA04227]QKW05209.1 alpha-ketoglutarate-dependent dioxygenase AlkB [Streptomyces sp. NA04227]